MNNVRELRTKRGYTLEEFAKLLNISKASLSLIERGIIGLNQTKLKKIADILEVSVSQLIGEYSIEQEKVYNIKSYNNINDLLDLNNTEYEYIGISKKLLDFLKIKDYKNLIISKNEDKNMEPLISNNDFLIIDISKIEPFNNKIYVIKERNYIKVKRVLMKSPIDTKITIQSDCEVDGEFPPYEIDIERAKDMILGQVVFYGRSIL